MPASVAYDPLVDTFLGIASKRDTRRYADRPVPEEVVQRILEAGRVSGLRLVGIGLGPGTEHVRTFYPESIASVPVEELADEIGLLLRQALLADVGAKV